MPATPDPILFLQEALANGQRPAAEVSDEAKLLNISERALKQERKNLNVKTEKVGNK